MLRLLHAESRVACTRQVQVLGGTDRISQEILSIPLGTGKAFVRRPNPSLWDGQDLRKKTPPIPWDGRDLRKKAPPIPCEGLVLPSHFYRSQYRRVLFQTHRS